MNCIVITSATHRLSVIIITTTVVFLEEQYISTFCPTQLLNLCTVLNLTDDHFNANVSAS